MKTVCPRMLFLIVDVTLILTSGITRIVCIVWIIISVSRISRIVMWVLLILTPVVVPLIVIPIRVAIVTSIVIVTCWCASSRMDWGVPGIAKSCLFICLVKVRPKNNLSSCFIHFLVKMIGVTGKKDYLRGFISSHSIFP